MPVPKAWILGVALGLLAAADARAEPPICTCRYGGLSYQLGTCVCIVTPNGQQRACCNKVLNNTSWSFKGNICPIAEVRGRTPGPQVAKASWPRVPAHDGPLPRAVFYVGAKAPYE